MISDFTIRASLRAERLSVHAPPDAETRPEGEGVAIERRELRTGLPRRLQAFESYPGAAVEKEVLCSLREPREPT